jgi:hypothetical protein
MTIFLHTHSAFKKYLYIYSRERKVAQGAKGRRRKNGKLKILCRYHTSTNIKFHLNVTEFKLSFITE